VTERVLLAGGTGLVGGFLTERLLARRDVEVTSLVRAPRRPGERAIDFEALAADPVSVIGPDPVNVGISSLGTTMRAAGSQAAFRRVDLDYVGAVARAAKLNGATRFVLLTSVGAGGRGFYLRVKGEAEAKVRAIGFERLDLVRPGLLLGDRRERRPGERLAQRAAPLLRFMLRGPLDAYAPIPAATVAAAIERLIDASEPGVHIHSNRELRALAR
jgi:uncharacterized protein YbjT (DUF2867 family)